MVHITNVKINTNKINNSKKILIISDLHLTKDNGFEHLKEIEQTVLSDEISQIIIPGDIYNDVNELKNRNFKTKSLQALFDFAQNRQVFISFGNHDLMTKVDNKWEKGNISLMEKAFENLPNFNLIHNGEHLTYDSISYSAFSPDFAYYEDEKKSRKDLESEDDYKEAFMKDYNPKLFDKTAFNIFLTHEPQSIIKLSTKKGSCIQDNTDLVISGHMHDGMVPHILKRVVNNTGIISPQKQLLPSYAHGTVKINDTTFIINGPVNAMVENSLANEIMGANATILDLKKIENNEHKNSKHR